MRRVISVWFPTFPTDRLGRPEEDQDSIQPPDIPRLGIPLVTVTNRLVTAVDTTATRLGLRSGMKLAQAQALVPGLAVHDADPAGDAAALQRLAEWCLRFAPLAAPDPPDGLWIDVTGSTHLHGDEVKLLRNLVARLGRHGWAASAAVADTPSVAHAVARFGGAQFDGAQVPDTPLGSHIVVPPGTDVMAGFPIEALRLPADMMADLRLMGFERIGPLAATPRAPLVRRFGPLLALRLDQAAGQVFEPISPVVPPTVIQARLTFLEPLLTAEAFSIAIARLVDTVCDELERAGQGARRLDLLFERVDGSVQALRVGTARSVRDAGHLTRMLNERLEQVDPGLGIEAMRLVAAAADPLGFVQTTSALVGSPSPDLGPLVDRLTNRLGEARVYRIAPLESDVPERCLRFMPPLLHVIGRWPADLPRPVRLLNPPQPVEAIALLPDHPPVAFTWRRVRHRIRHADGPERIAGEWWKRDREWLSVRDYFRVEDEDGRRFWLFRRGNGSDMETGDMRWFLHGVF